MIGQVRSLWQMQYHLWWDGGMTQCKKKMGGAHDEWMCALNELVWAMKWSSMAVGWIMTELGIWWPGHFYGAKNALLPNGRKIEERKARKRHVRVIADFIDVLDELVWGALLKLVAHWLSMTKQDDFDSKPPFVSMGPTKHRKMTKKKERARTSMSFQKL